MKTEYLRCIFAAFAIAALVLPSFAFADDDDDDDDRNRPQQVTVDCSRGETISDALANASAAVPLFIKVVGVCNEQVTINVDNITVDGDGTAVIDGIGILNTRPLIRVHGNNVLIRGLTIRNSPWHGIQVRRSGSALIRNNIVMDNARHGVVVAGSSFAQIGASGNNHIPAGSPGSEGNIIQGNGEHGVRVLAASASVFHNEIFANTIAGISLLGGAVADVAGNVIIGNGSGLDLTLNASVRLSDHVRHDIAEPNLIQGNAVGVRCQLGGALGGNPQDFGTGNTTDTDLSTSCPVDSTLNF